MCVTMDNSISPRQEADPRESYKRALEVLKTNPDDASARERAGWALRQLLEEAAHNADADSFEVVLRRFAALRLHEIGKASLNNRASWHLSKLFSKLRAKGPTDLMVVSRLFDIIKTMVFDPAEKYYVYFLDAFLKLSDDKGPWPRFYEMACWWGLDNFGESHFAPTRTHSGHDMPSVAERTFAAASRDLLRRLRMHQPTQGVDQFITQLLDVAAKHPDFTFPAYHAAKILTALGRNDEARELLMPFARKRQSEFWVWESLGDTYTGPKDRIGCYIMALECHADEQFTRRLKEKCGALLQSVGLTYEASREAAVAHARSLLLEAVEEVPVLVTSSNSAKCVFSFAMADHTRGFCNYKKVFAEAPSPNTVLLARLERKSAQSDSWNLVTARPDSDMGRYAGVFFRKAKGVIVTRGSYSEIGDILVPQKLAAGVETGREVVVTASLYYNLSAKRWGWRAFAVE